VLLHDGEEANDDLGRRPDQHLAFPCSFRIVNVVKALGAVRSFGRRQRTGARRSTRSSAWWASVVRRVERRAGVGELRSRRSSPFLFQAPILKAGAVIASACSHRRAYQPESTSASSSRMYAAPSSAPNGTFGLLRKTAMRTARYPRKLRRCSRTHRTERGASVTTDERVEHGWGKTAESAKGRASPQLQPADRAHR
jgi:hypothetical protein